MKKHCQDNPRTYTCTAPQVNERVQTSWMAVRHVTRLSPALPSPASRCTSGNGDMRHFVPLLLSFSWCSLHNISDLLPWMLLFFSDSWTDCEPAAAPRSLYSLSRWLLMSSAGEISLRSLLCANLINAPCLPSFAPPPWCRNAINHLHKPLLWDSLEKKTADMFKVHLCLSLSLSPVACDFHQECFIWIIYYMCCLKVLKGGFNMWILCSVACDTSMRGTEKRWHLWAQMHFTGPLVFRRSI